jgi:hypothetical protein
MVLRRQHPKQVWFRGIGLAVAFIAGCRHDQQQAAAGGSGDTSAPADSLITFTADGVEIWFTLARAAVGTDGKRCVERGLEIRRGGTRVPVPLLYTGDPPILLNDSTMRAVLWTHCRPLDAYLVDLRSGRPVREGVGKSS